MNWYETHPAVRHIRELHEEASRERLARAAGRGLFVGRPRLGDYPDQRPPHRSIIASLMMLGTAVGWGADSRDGFGHSSR